MLYLGVGREIITPKIGTYLGGYGSPGRNAVTVNDDLHVTAFCFRSKQNRAMLVSVEVVMLDEDICLFLREKIEKETGVSKDSIIIHAIHTHSAPVTFTLAGWGKPDGDYIESILVPKMISAAKNAAESEVLVKMAFRQGKSYVGINRREPDPVTNKIMLGCWDAGCFNPNMSILSFYDEKDKCVANIIHYGCHATASGINLEVSRDWPGVMIDALESHTGGITAFFNGAEGDVGPRLGIWKTVGAKDVKYALEHGEIAARDVLSIYETKCEPCEVDLCKTVRRISLPLKRRMSYDEAKSGVNIRKSGPAFTERQENYHKKILDSYESGELEKEYREIEQIAIRLGDVALFGVPFELFSEMPIRINLASEIPNVLCVALANGYLGYLPTKSEIYKGGYEIDMFTTESDQIYTDDVDFAVVTETLKTLENLKGEW